MVTIVKIVRIVVYGVIVLLLLVALSILCIRLFVENKTVETSAPEATEFLTVDDEIIAFRKWPGESERTVFLVGGLSAWSNTWEKTVMEQRTRGNNDTFIAVDLPPFGYSQPNAAVPYYRDVQARRLSAVVKHYASKEIILVGHSYGGGPVAELMLTEPDLADGVILISPVLNLGAVEKNPPPLVVTVDWLRTAAVTLVLRIEPLLLKQLKSFVHITDNISYDTLRLYTQPLDIRGTSPRLAQWILDYTVDPVHTHVSSQVDLYQSTAVPVHFIWGEEDTLTPITDVTPLMGNKLFVLKPLTGVGHIPMLEDVTYFNDMLAGSLGEL